MSLLLGIMGMGGKATSSGIHDNIERLASRYGWHKKTFTRFARKAPADLIRKHQGERIIVVANSMGVDAIDDILEANPDIKVDIVFAVVSALPEEFPDNAEEIQRITATKDRLRNFELKGRNLKTIEIDATHLDADDSPELWALIESEMANKESEPSMGYKLTPRIALEVAAHEGLVQEAYKDSVGIWTWSIGVTDFSGHKVRRYIDNPVDIERCIEVYIWLLDTKYLPAVQRAFQGRNLTESQLAAALSFHWNTGSIEKASWVRSFLAGDMAEARRKFMLWKKPPEIIGRRKRERDLFFDGKWHGDGTVTHYPLVHSGGRLNFTQTKRLDISDAVTKALEEHYSPALPVPVEPANPLPEPIVGDLDDFLAGKYPNTEPEARQRAAMLANAIAFALNQPANKRGFLQSETKETNMTFNFLNWTSKTFWVGAAMVVAGILELIAPGTPLTALTSQFFGDIEAGMLITNGLAIVFGREAIDKVA